jgi:hypothetical protein
MVTEPRGNRARNFGTKNAHMIFIMLTVEEMLNGICKGTPLRLTETGDRVYFRSARVSPYGGTPLAVVADENGGLYAFSAEELDREVDENEV